MIEYRPFGQTGITVSAIGMGCGRLGSSWHKQSTRAGKAGVAAALECGITFFDTADCYGLGRSERLLGREVRRMGRRSDVVIATKYGLVKTPAAVARGVASSWDTVERAGGSRLTAVVGETRRLLNERKSYSSRYIERAVEASLRRMRTDYVDVLLLHSPSKSVLNDVGFVETLKGLKKKGTIRAYGLSLLTAEDARLALSRFSLDCIEIEVNLCSGATTNSLLSDAQRSGVAVIARQPFASGALLARGAEASRSAGGAGDGAPGSVRKACLQFVLLDDRVSVMIPGMTRPEHVRQNVSAATSEPLPQGLIEEIQRRVCVARSGNDNSRSGVWSGTRAKSQQTQ